MNSAMDLARKRQAAAAVGRSFGALFFSTFGAAWLVLAMYAFGHLTMGVEIALVGGWAAMVLPALQLQRRGRQAARGAYTPEEKSRTERAFGIVNAVQWIAVFGTFQLCARLHHTDIAFPIVVLIVGLHLFAMPTAYRHRDNLVTGLVLTLWAIICLVAFRGDRLIAMSALGAGVVLWLSANRGLVVAQRRLATVTG